MTHRIRQAILQRDYGRLDEAGLDPEMLTRYLAVLARLAAADGVSVGEHVLVERIAGFLGVSEQVLARAFLVAEDRAVSTEALAGSVRDRGLALCLLRDAYRVASSDRDLTPAELVVLGEIAGALDFEDGVASEVRGLVLEENRVHRAFATLVRRAQARELDRAR